MKVLLLVSLIAIVLWAIPDEDDVKLNPFTTPYPLSSIPPYTPSNDSSLPSTNSSEEPSTSTSPSTKKSVRESMPLPYWFGMNYNAGPGDPLCNSTEEYMKMISYPSLCLNLLENIVTIGAKPLIIEDGRVWCSLRSCFSHETPLLDDQLKQQAEYCCESR